MTLQKFLIPLFLLVALGLGYYFTNQTENKNQLEDVTLTIQEKEFVIKVDATGELKAKKSVKITAPSGMSANRVYETTIQNLVPEGTMVKAGDFVATLDRTEIANQMGDAQSEIDKILTQLEQAEIDTAITLRGLRDEMINIQFSKEEKLLEIEQNKYEPEAIKLQKEIDLKKLGRDFRQLQSKYRLEQDKAIAKIAEINASLKQNQSKHNRLDALGKEFTIMAPEAGMIIYARGWNGKITSGSRIQVWDPTVAELPDLSEMLSKTYVNEIDVSKVEKGQEVNIKIDAFPDYDYKGRVLSVANIGEELKGYDAKVFEVNIELSEIDSFLRPAMTTSNEIITDVLPKVLAIPMEALYNDSIPFVYKTQNGKTIKQEVITGSSNNNEIIIDYGLEVNDEVYLSVPENPSKLSFQYLSKEIKEKIAAEQAKREKKRLARMEANRKLVKEEEISSEVDGGGGGVIIVN